MDFETALREGCYKLELAARTKREAIEELLDMLVGTGKISDRQAVLDAILEREEKMSTGLQHGVAIPHAKTENVEDLVTAFGMKREGIDFGALDGQPSRIFVMTLSSVLRTGPHLEYLSEISRLLNSEPVRERLLEAESTDEVIKILSGEQ